ncbi:MAG TPA: glycerol-3-phosphate dehydrogenase [Xanthobacteraceae bacterium]|nr:glycerol-3-phosphate dehydrogenase [Xanthobacteraceae bacterium]
MSETANPVDIFVIGGGVNGCGIARDAAGRGFSVRLAEMNDLASGTSSKATKLIHGGLRYLEHYEFRLVREALTEREVIWRNAPHLVRPLRFVLPYAKGLRPAWMLRLGLFLYDYLGGRKKLPPTKTLDLTRDPAGVPLKAGFTKGFEYSDCWVDDARFVVMNARDAADRGAIIETRKQVVSARVDDGLWLVRLRDRDTGAESEARARLLVNAAGPWVDHVIGVLPGNEHPKNVRQVQGSHIVVPKLFEHDRCYIFQNADQRIIFAIPYEDRFTLIGTTDRDYHGDLGAIEISKDETDYLCAAASEYFKRQIKAEDVVWTYSGVRPLFDDHATAAQEATRDYVLQDEDVSGAPLINIFGGKITTYRRLTEAVLEHVERQIGERGKPWTADAPLPGGDFDKVAELAATFRKKWPFLPDDTLRRFVRSYGTRAEKFFGDAKTIDDLGRDFGAGLTEAEVNYLIDEEWARSADDILWRRSKLGLLLKPSVSKALDAYIAERLAAAR